MFNSVHITLKWSFVKTRRFLHHPYMSILELFIGTRVILLLITYIGYTLLTAPKYSSIGIRFSTLLAVWNRWDAANYVRIAQYGYQSIYDYAFFPLYPLAIHWVSHFLGHYLLVAMLLSNIATLGAFIVIYHLAADITNEHTALRSVLYLSIFPTAFYLFAAYNESFFILFAAGSLLAMRHERWILAGLLGALASATRPAGLLLVLPYLYQWWIARDRSQNYFLFFAKLLPIFLIPVGILLYSFYCWKVTGDPFAYVFAQVRWNRHTTLPWQGIWLALHQLFQVQPFGSFFQVHILLDLCATLGFLLLLFLGLRLLPLSYTLWSTAVLLLILMSSSPLGDPLVSNQRIVLELFPCFIVLALISKKWMHLHHAILLSFPPLLAVLSIVFFMNRWMV